MLREETFSHYWEKLEKRIYAMVRRYGFRLEKEDALQDAALLLCQALADFDPKKKVPFEGYYMARLRFHFMDAGRALGEAPVSLESSIGEDLTIADTLKDPALTPLEALLYGELAEDLQKALQGLSPRQRQILLLVEGEGVKMAEAARFLGISHRTVINTRKRSLKKLNHELAKERSEYVSR